MEKLKKFQVFKVELMKVQITLIQYNAAISLFLRKTILIKQQLKTN